MIKSIFYIDKEKFRTKALELACKQQGIDIYTQNDFDSARHFILDISPELVLVDLESLTAANDIEQIRDPFQGISGNGAGFAVLPISVGGSGSKAQ